MPIYEYRCGDCGHEFETIQKVSEQPLRRCPACEADALVKKVSAAAFRLKGGGWYETDFKSGNKRNVSGDKADDAPKSTESSGKSESADGAGSKSSTSESKSDSKPASKSSAAGKSSD